MVFQAPFGVGRAVNALRDRFPGGRSLAAGALRRHNAAAAQFDEDLAKRLIRPGVLFVTDPEGVFVELDLFALDAAEDHRAEPPVANRQRLLFAISGRFQRTRGR